MICTNINDAIDVNISVDMDMVIAYIGRYCSPEDVFDYATLAEWAEDHGFESKKEWDW